MKIENLISFIKLPDSFVETIRIRVCDGTKLCLKGTIEQLTKLFASCFDNIVRQIISKSFKWQKKNWKNKAWSVKIRDESEKISLLCLTHPFKKIWRPALHDYLEYNFCRKNNAFVWRAPFLMKNVYKNSRLFFLIVFGHA